MYIWFHREHTSGFLRFLVCSILPIHRRPSYRRRFLGRPWQGGLFLQILHVIFDTTCAHRIRIPSFPQNDLKSLSEVLLELKIPSRFHA